MKLKAKLGEFDMKTQTIKLYDVEIETVKTVIKQAIEVKTKRRKKTSAKRWTPEELKTLKTMLAEGYKYSKIARELNRTEKSISNAVYRFIRIKELPQSLTDTKRKRKPYKKWSTQEIHKLLDLYDRGFSYKAIASALGRGYDQVKAKLNYIRRKSV